MTPQEEKPPILGSWNRLYAAVAAYLCILIALFTWFTWSWNR